MKKSVLLVGVTTLCVLICTINVFSGEEENRNDDKTKIFNDTYFNNNFNGMFKG